MKKILTLCLAVLTAAVTVNAKDYKHSLGMYGGFGIGIQYKVMPKEHFTIIVEEGYAFCPSRTANVGGYQSWATNCVLAYQTKTLAEGQGIKLGVYAGGQVKFHYAFDNAGLIGLGAAAGIEANMTNAPIAFSFDFRPGYGCLITSTGGWTIDPVTGDLVPAGGCNVTAAHLFDCSLNLGIRYTF